MNSHQDNLKDGHLPIETLLRNQPHLFPEAVEKIKNSQMAGTGWTAIHWFRTKR